MIRFGLLQFRAQAVAALAVLAAVAVALLVTGAHLIYLYDSSGLAGCAPHGDCTALASALLARVRGYGAFPVIYWGGIDVLYLVPAVIGTFWGAPVITREIDAGTLRMAWTQGVTRDRWLAVKLGGWVYSSQVLSASGRTSLGPAPRACASDTGQACLNALGRLHLRQVVTYQPGSRYWPLQWAETSLFLALALAGFCFWWIRRHLPGQPPEKHFPGAADGRLRRRGPIAHPPAVG